MPDEIIDRLREYGAARSQLVDLNAPESPRTLRYLDLKRRSEGRAPVVLESQNQPRAYIFSAPSTELSESSLRQWVRRVAFRGDAQWVGVLRPGRLDVFPAVLNGPDLPTAVRLPDKALVFPWLVQTRSPGVEGAIRSKLLELLRNSISSAVELGLDSADALSLVGRALFWRFLIDRGLLDGLDIREVCSGASTWPSCLESKPNALQTFEWLETTFNGGLLPWATDPRTFKSKVFEQVVGNIAHLAPAGQLPIRLPNDWSEVNFAHVPVGLLSEVYEAYAHDEDAVRARAESIYYTPRHIAEFVVDEALDALEDVAQPRALDPAAGAGVFLVATFRALVAREWARSQEKPSRKTIRRILNRQLVGFDINDSALRLAELALYLTAIELDPEPKHRPLSLLRFEELRGRALHCVEGGKDQGSLAAVDRRFRGAFDLVIGNPPWTAKADLRAKASWVEASRPVVTQRLGEQRAKDFDLPDTNPDLPFVYRAMEWAREGGRIALVTHARWLFSQKPLAIQARQDLLESVHVTGVLNGAELRDSKVWPKVRSPFCLLFAVNTKAPERAAFFFISPELDQAPDTLQDRLRIDWKDATEVEVREVISTPDLLKTRFRGTPFDEDVLRTLQTRGIPLAAYLESLGTSLNNGYKVAPEAKQESAQHLHDLTDLKGRELEFLVPTDLPPFNRPTLHRPRARSIYRCPLLLVHESMRVDPESPRAALALQDVAFDQRFHGASFAEIRDGIANAAYLQLVIQSSIFQHAMLLTDGQFGTEREVVRLSAVESIPVVPWDDLPAHQKRTSDNLSRMLRKGMTPGLLSDIDAFVGDVYGLTQVQRTAIRDTLVTALPTAAAKKNAVRLTTASDRQTFAQVCEGTLSDLLKATERRALVRLRDDLEQSPWRLVQVDDLPLRAPLPPEAPLDLTALVEAADEASASLVTVQVNPTTRLIGILDRYRYWTTTRARILAASLASRSRFHG